MSPFIISHIGRNYANLFHATNLTKCVWIGTNCILSKDIMCTFDAHFKAKTFLGVTTIICQTFLFSATMIATSKFGFIVMSKLIATLFESKEMLTSFLKLVDVVSQDELVDKWIVKTTFVSPLQTTIVRLQELYTRSTIDCVMITPNWSY